VLLFLLNAYWYLLILKGLGKMMGIIKPSNEKKIETSE